MIVEEQKEIEFINKCEVTVDLYILRKAILWYQDKPTARLKTIYMHGNYPAVSIHKEKIHIHRLLAMYSANRKLNHSEYVHHNDGNRLNAMLSNLKLMAAEQHQSFHNKGKVQSEIHRRRIGEANKNRKGIKYPNRSCVTHSEVIELYKKGLTINQISKQLGVDWSTIKSRLKEIHDNPELLKGGE